MNALAHTDYCPTLTMPAPEMLPGLTVQALAAPAMPSGFGVELLTEMWSDLTGDRIELTSASDLLALSILGAL